MTHRTRRWFALLIACALSSGCLLNSVASIGGASRTKPDQTHAIVVIGIGLEAAWPHSGFSLTFPEYSLREQRITGNCFHYNRIELTRPSRPAHLTYLAFEVPANTYVYLSQLDLIEARSAAAPIGRAFIAPPGGTVYFGDYVLVDDKSVEFRRDIDAARAATGKLLPQSAVLQLAQPTAAPGVRMFICTP